MPVKASRLEQAFRIAPVMVALLKEDGSGIEEIVLNIKYRPLTLAKLEEWDAAEKKVSVEIVAPEADEPTRDKDTLARQLSEVVIDLDLTELDGVTPKRVTLEYLKTLDLGLLKDVKRAIEERAFPEKKELMDLLTRSKASSSGT